MKNEFNMKHMANSRLSTLIVIVTAIVLITSNGCKKADNTSNTVSDKDGNVYKTITIGSQTWMAENLKTTKYSDETPIPLIPTLSAWNGLQTPGCCFYDNNESTYKKDYGALYNWFAIDGKSNGYKNVCPSGWHVPDDSDWTILITFLGGVNAAGGKMKEAGIAHWKSPNTGATDEYRFKALPGGEPVPPLSFLDMGYIGKWWSSTESYYLDANYVYLSYDDERIIKTSYYKSGGFSIRCLNN